jgi:hypothetical protein
MVTPLMIPDITEKYIKLKENTKSIMGADKGWQGKALPPPVKICDYKVIIRKPK